MIRLSSVIEQFEDDFMHQYAHRLLASQAKALAAMKACRNRYSPLMQAHCDSCDSDQYFPHSCGNRHCPHCQHHESQQWLENQCRKQVPANYFMITFTVPAQLRKLFFRHQRQCYGLLFKSLWDTLQTFAHNDKKLKLPDGCPRQWVVDCKPVGSGEKALVYLGPYLYRGVIQEKDILSWRNGKVTFRYLDSKTKHFKNKTVSGTHFLWLVLQHVLQTGHLPPG